MRILSAVKVKIGLKENGYAKYPDFNLLQCVVDAKMDWCCYVDVYGLGWQYDKTSGHKEETVDSPAGQQWGVLVAPKAFVDQAVVMFPDECAAINETELEDFWDNKAHAHEADEIVDEKIINTINAKIAASSTGIDGLSIAERTKINNALDMDNAEPGIKRNRNKRWADAKVMKGVVIE